MNGREAKTASFPVRRRNLRPRQNMQRRRNILQNRQNIRRVRKSRAPPPSRFPPVSSRSRRRSSTEGGDDGEEDEKVMGAGTLARLAYDEHPCDSLPDVLLVRILSLLPSRHIAAAALVCRSWRAAVADPSLWESLCQDTGLRAADEIRHPGGWRALFAMVYGRSLVSTSCFEPLDQVDVDRSKKRKEGPWVAKHRVLLDRIHTEGDACEGFHRYSHWAVEGGSQFHRGGGDGVVRERPPIACPVCPSVPDGYVIATSYEWGRLQQYIGLQSFSNKFLDESPPLALTAWYAGCKGVEGEFRLYIVMRDELKNCLIVWESGVMASKSEEWQQAKLLIQGYPKGLRTMMLKVAGRSKEQRSGCQGTKFTDIRLYFVPVCEVKHYSEYSRGTLLPPT